MKIKDLGEFGLIDLFRSITQKVSPKGLVTGSGDDTAVFQPRPGMETLATCDALVEGAHFLPSAKNEPVKLGKKAAAVSISDIAAMGGTPTFVLVSLSLPPGTMVEFARGLCQGMADECFQHGAAIIGGNLARSDHVQIHVTVLGEVEAGKALLRSRARAGDLLAVSGTLGDSAAGLRLLQNPAMEVEEDARAQVLAAHQTPSPQVALGRALGKSGLVGACMDVSDGLLSDLGHLCKASGVGAEIQAAAVPISDASCAVARASETDALSLALSGGEDYQLLFSVPPQNQSAFIDYLAPMGLAPVSFMGRLTENTGQINLVNEQGKLLRPAGIPGWNHFQST